MDILARGKVLFSLLTFGALPAPMYLFDSTCFTSSAFAREVFVEHRQAMTATFIFTYLYLHSRLQVFLRLVRTTRTSRTTRASRTQHSLNHVNHALSVAILV